MADSIESANEVPELGVRATVVIDEHTHGPRTLADRREGLRTVAVFPGAADEFYSEVGGTALVGEGLDDAVLALDSSAMEEPLVEELDIVSTYSLHVALYALQQIVEIGKSYEPDPGARLGRMVAMAQRARYLLGTSGDCEEATNHESLFPLPVPEPSGWTPRDGDPDDGVSGT